MKREIFVVAKPGSGRKIESEADLLASLAADYRTLLAEFPMRDKAWQMHVQSGKQTAREEIAWALAYRNLELVAALRDGLPAWKTATLGMAYQDLLRIYRGPSDATFRGKAYAKDKEPRRAKDALTVRVLAHLRGQGKTWPESLEALEDAARDGRQIARVDIEKNRADKWIFRRQRRGEPEQVEGPFAESTLRDKKFRKPKSD